MGVILDSDTLSILQWRSQPECGRLEQRLSQLSDDDVFTILQDYRAMDAMPSDVFLALKL